MSKGENVYNFIEFGMNRKGYIHCVHVHVFDSKLNKMFDDEYEDDGLLTSIFKKIFG